MSARQREEQLENFRLDPLTTICLVSLRAGAYGLNLTCASQCVMMDPFWNPFIEAQAIDRIHRIGQVRPVKVHRIVIPGTVEDRILALQDKVSSLKAMCNLRNVISLRAPWRRMPQRRLLVYQPKTCCSYSVLTGTRLFFVRIEFINHGLIE